MPRPPEYFDSLQSLLELERQEQRRRFEQLHAELPLGELESRGLCVLGLRFTEEAVGLGGRFLVTLEREDGRPMGSLPQPGDLARLVPAKAEAPQPASGVIVRSTRRSVQVAFERPAPPFVYEGRLVLELVPNDVTFDRAAEAVRQVAAWEQGAVRHKRELLLGNEPPRFEEPVPPGERAALNAEQREAANRALSASDFFLVHGPPGTGKSTVLAEIVERAVAAGERVLCTAASNAAVDHLLELCLARGLPALRVGHPARVAPLLQEHTLDLVVEDHPDRKLAAGLFQQAFDLLGYARRQRKQGLSRERFANAREAQVEARRMMDEARALERKALAAVLGRARVLCATLSTVPGSALVGERFDRAVVDEATQAIEPLTLVAFLRAPRVVLAGDHRQLAPTVLSPQAAQRGLGRSLFERLLEDHGPGVKKMLREQYRMSQELMQFPSIESYGGELRAHPSVAGRRLSDVLPPGANLDAPPLIFLDTAGKGFDEEQEAKGESLLNRGEATYVLKRVQALLTAGLSAQDIAVIAPYRAQAAHLREQLSLADLEVDTVDAFQGREKEAVLVSLVRSNPDRQMGFLTDLRRMNVALTRAKRHLFVVGDSATLCAEPYYTRLIERAQQLGGYRSAWEWPEG